MKKVGELYNIPIVEGDPNLLTHNQLLYKDGVLSRRASTGDIKNLGNSSGGAGTESGGAEPTEYYSINWTKLNELGYTDDDFNNNASSFLRDAVFSCSAYKIIMQGNTRIVNINEMWQLVTLLDGMFRYSFITAIAFTPYTQLPTNTYISSLKDIWNWVGQPFDEIFTPITKEQFYNLEV